MYTFIHMYNIYLVNGYYISLIRIWTSFRLSITSHSRRRYNSKYTANKLSEIETRYNGNSLLSLSRKHYCMYNFRFTSEFRSFIFNSYWSVKSNPSWKNTYPKPFNPITYKSNYFVFPHLKP